MTVSSTSNPQILVWLNACTEEVQNCRQIAAIGTVIQTDYQYKETSEGSGEPVAQGVTLTKGNLEHENLPLQGRSRSIVPCSRDLPGKTDIPVAGLPAMGSSIFSYAAS